MASVNNSLVKKEDDEKTISTYFMKEMVKKKIVEMVGEVNVQRFMTSIISAVSNNYSLQECDYGSIVSAALLGESLKLNPSPQLGHFYMVPFKVKTGLKDEKGEDIYIKKAQFQIGYKGYIQLMKRSGIYKKINVIAIKEGELISYDPLSEELEVKLIEDDEIRENTPTVGYYAMFEEENGFKKAIYWTKKKMLVHADKYSMAFNKETYQKILDGKIPQKDMWKYSSFWYKDFDGMAFKTMLRQLISKWGTMSIDMQDMREAYTKDMAEIKENGDFTYIDNPEDPIAIVPGEIVDKGQDTNEEQDNITNENKSKTRSSSKNVKSDIQAEKTTVKTNVIENTDMPKEGINTNIENTNSVMEDIDGNEYEDPFAFLND